MAYNNGFPMTYYPAQGPYLPAGAAQAPQATNASVIWVQGENGAKSYLVAPNSTVVLFDSESQTIYLKSADASGMPTLRILDYTIRDAQAQSDNYKTEIDDIKKQISDLRRQYESLIHTDESAE